MIERNFSQQWQPHITAIGKLPGSLKTYQLQGNHLQPTNQYEGIMTTSPPATIVSQNGVLAVIDQKRCLWVIGNIFYQPVNLSQLVKMKAKTVFLGQGQLLMQNKKKDLVLITWSSKAQFCADKIKRIVLSKGPWSHLFEAYFVQDQAEQGSIFYYSTLKKLQNTIKLYHLNKSQKKIIGLPLNKTMSVRSQPLGLSLGKYHGLIWTEDGRLFSWGSKNLGLGLSFYDKSYYDELQQISLPQMIIKAYAGTNYSIALTKNGILYQWGQNSKKQMIVVPRILDLGGLKFVNVKGFLNTIGGLTSQNKFFLWGKGIENIILEKKEILQPYEIKKHENTKIMDFEIEQNYIIFIVCQDKGKLSHDQKIYFNEVIEKVSIKWLPHRSKSNKTCLNKTQQVRSPIQTPSKMTRRASDFIDRLVSECINKENFFSEVQYQNRFYKKIMAQPAPQPNFKLQNNFFTKIKQPFVMPKLKKGLHKKAYTAKDSSSLVFDIQSQSKFIKEMENSLKKQQLSVQRIKKMIKPKKQKNNQTKHQRQKTFFLQVQDAQISNNKTCSQFSTHKNINNKGIINQSFDYFQNTSANLQKVADIFNKAYIMIFLRQVISEGKIVKIKQLKKKISIDKSKYNFSNLIKKKSCLSILDDMQVQKPIMYQKIINLITNAMYSWKKTKVDKNRKTIMPFIMKSVLKKKIKEGLGSVWLKSRKLKKISKWLVIEHKQRLLHFKALWKKCLLLFMKPTPSFQNKRPSVCRQQLNFKPNHDKGKHIKFSQFMNKSPIIQFKLTFPVSIQKLQIYYLQAEQYARNERQHFSLKKRVSWAQKYFRQTRLQSNQPDLDKKSNHLTFIVDVLPYSYHYNSYFKQKNFQLNIPDNMKQSQKWVKEEKKVLDQLLKSQIYKLWVDYCLRKREYESKLALFIRDNYDHLAQYRWRFIIQYNKIFHESPSKIRKRQDELVRLLKKIGAQALFENDVIPQRHKILDYVSLLKGNPTVPQLQIKLSQIQFKKLFKVYYQQITVKSKHFRKFFN